MNAQELSRRLADSAARVAAYLLPSGKKQGREWKVGNVSGDAGDSLSVCISGAKAGIWSDFSAGIGGDLLDLWVATRRCDLAEAMREAKQYLGVRDDAPLKPPKREPYKLPAKPQCRTPKARVRDWLMGRGLTEETIAAFKIGEQERGDKVYAIFPYLRDGELVNTKCRNPDEKKDMLQAGGAEPCLFGWHLIEPNARMVAIFEGEIDAMTGHQVGIPSLSVNAGAGSHQWIENDWERLQQFSDIVLCYDNDEAGHKGVREVATRLGLERCRIAIFGKAKDANEYLTEYKASGEDFEHCIKQARGLDPDELQQLADFMPATQAMFWPAHDAPAYPRLSFCGRDMDWWEWLPARVSVWTGINGHGKSLMLNQALIPVMQSDIPVCMFSGELTPAQQLKRLAKQITGIDRPTPAYLNAVQDWLQGRMWIFNVVGVAGLDRLLEVFAYAASRYGCGHFVIDSLMMLDVPEDGPGSMTAQKTAMRKIVSFAHATQSHVHLVAHPRKANDETKAPGKLDVAGSGHITNGADNVFSVWSAQKPPGEDTDTPDARLEVLKDRDDVGRRKVSLYFNRSTGQYTLDDARRSYQYLKFSQEAR